MRAPNPETAAPAINRSMNAVEWGMLAALSLLWGGSFLFTAVAVTEIPPLTNVLLRVGLAALVLALVIRAAGQRLPTDKAAWRGFFAIGLINNVIPFCLIAWSQTHIASGLASILNATTPLWTVIVAHLLTSDEKMTLNRLAGVMVGIVGVAWMIGTDVLHGLGTNVLAQFAMLGAALSYAFAGVYSRRFARMGLAPMVTATGQLTASGIIMLPIAFIMDRPWTLPIPSPAVLGAVAGMVLLATALAFILYFRILATAGATNLMLVTFLIPVSAILFGTLILHERLAPKHFAGMALIALGLALIDGRLLTLLRTRLGGRRPPRVHRGDDQRYAGREKIEADQQA